MIDIKFSLFCAFSLLCFFYLNVNRKTEIVEFEDLRSKHIYGSQNIFYPEESKEKVVSFIVSNPPKYGDSLLMLVSKHFQLYVPNDTVKKYIYYTHRYYKETWFTHRGYIEVREQNDAFYHNYLNHRRKDLLFEAMAEMAKHNEQEIFTGISFYKEFKDPEREFYRYIEEKIKKIWKEK